MNVLLIQPLGLLAPHSEKAPKEGFYLYNSSGDGRDAGDSWNVAFLRNQERTHIHGSRFWMDAHNPAVIISFEKVLAGQFCGMHYGYLDERLGAN
ncbi:unnamed protein product [Darwinula stevensoni]|uniref:Uncharacterized protein n=1 Tax=Darwinula stevensoni TaxID=69355 RepID=A0A7R9ACH9_9CRUS|nr:unnamed protein product [Darwinula stevensoni]CAG0900119.1 unnamed protein product [Darwinula stevensoni]